MQWVPLLPFKNEEPKAQRFQVTPSHILGISSMPELTRVPGTHVHLSLAELDEVV